MRWKMYINFRRLQKERKAVGEAHWRAVAGRKCLRAWVGGLVEDRKTEALLKKAKYWFSDILVYRTFQNWVGWLAEMRQMKRAVAMFRDAKMYKCFLGWVRYVGERIEKRELVEKAARWRAKRDMDVGFGKWLQWMGGQGAEAEMTKAAEAFWARGAKKRALVWMRENAELMGKLRNAMRWMNGNVEKRCFMKLKVYCQGRREKREREQMADEWREERGARKALSRMREVVVKREAMREYKAVGDMFYDAKVRRGGGGGEHTATEAAAASAPSAFAGTRWGAHRN
jgi:hypothetical protein